MFTIVEYITARGMQCRYSVFNFFRHVFVDHIVFMSKDISAWVFLCFLFHILKKENYKNMDFSSTEHNTWATIFYGT